MTWNRKELFELVTAHHGNQQAELIKPALVAVNAKSAIVHYHVEEFECIISEMFMGGETDDYIQAVRLIFEQASGSESGSNFSLAQFKAEANLIAFSQALHSLADIFGQIIFYSLDLNKLLPKKIKENRLYLYTVSDSIKNAPQLAALSNALITLIDSNQYKYLSAYVNTTKHRSLISANYSVDFKIKIEPIHGMKIPKFGHKTKEYESKWSHDFIGVDKDYIFSNFVNIGFQLNQTLKELTT